MKNQIKNFDEYFDKINESLADDANHTCDEIFLRHSDDAPTKGPDGKIIPAQPIIRFKNGKSVTPQEIVDVVQDAISYLKDQYRRTFYFANHTMSIIYLPHSNIYRTMAVDKHMNMYINAGFVYNSLKMDPLLVAAVIMHEVFHVVYNHIERSENWLSSKGKPVTQSTWDDTNLAADVEVNQTLVKIKLITEERLVNEIRGIYLSNKNNYNDILTLEMILNNEELMNELREICPTPPEPEGEDIHTSDDWDGGYKDGWNGIGELVKKYGYKKVWEGLISSGLLNKVGEIMVEDIKTINLKIEQMKYDLGGGKVMSLLQVKSYEDFINEETHYGGGGNPGETYDDGYMTGFSQVVGIINQAIKGGGGGGPKGPKIDTNVNRDDLIGLPPLSVDGDNNDDDDDDEGGLPTNVDVISKNKKNKKKPKSSDENGGGNDSDMSDDELVNAASKMVDDLEKKSNNQDRDSQSRSGDNSNKKDGQSNDKDAGQSDDKDAGDKDSGHSDDKDAGHGSFLNDDNTPSDEDLADAGYSKEDIDELNKVRHANNQRNSPARLRKVLNDYRNQVDNSYILKLLDKIDVESNKYKNIWENILEKFLSKRTRRAGKAERIGNNDWKKKKSIALGSYGINRKRISIDPQDINIYADVSGSMDEELLEIIAKSLVILMEKYEYSGINIFTWATRSAGPIQIDTIDNKGKDAITADIMGAISLGRQTCGGSTEAHAILSGILNGYEENLKDPDKNTKDDVHVIITDGYVSGFAGIEKDIESVLYHTFNKRDVAARVPENTIWMIYDADESLRKEWEHEIKKGKLLFINSDNVKNNSKKHK